MSNFHLESDKAIIILGHSERKKTGELLASELDRRSLFDDIDVLTLNSVDTKLGMGIGRAALLDGLKKSTVITHSAGIMRVPYARQVIALNGPEPTTYSNQIKSALAIGKDPMKERSEIGAHKIGVIDLALAGLQMTPSLVSSFRTMKGIHNGFSTSMRLAEAEDDFPAGRAIIHSQYDGFTFPQRSQDFYARINGVEVVMLPDHYHNEVLFAPGKTLDMLSPTIFPTHQS